MTKNFYKKFLFMAMMIVLFAMVHPPYSAGSEVTGTITAGSSHDVGQPAAFTVAGPSNQTNTINGAFIFKSAVIGILIIEVVILIALEINRRRKVLRG